MCQSRIKSQDRQLKNKVWKPRTQRPLTPLPSQARDKCFLQQIKTKKQTNKLAIDHYKLLREEAKKQAFEMVSAYIPSTSGDSTRATKRVEMYLIFIQCIVFKEKKPNKQNNNKQAGTSFSIVQLVELKVCHSQQPGSLQMSCTCF